MTFRHASPSLSFLVSTLALGCFAAGCGDDGRMPDDAGDAMTDAPPTDGGPGDGGDAGDAGDAGPVGPPGCGPGPYEEPTITTCPGDDLPAPSDGVCEVTAGDGFKLITGDVLLPGEVLRGGQVLVDEAGLIACVGCDCSSEAGAAGATTVVCPDAVVSPGIINAHDHITFDAQPAYDPIEEHPEMLAGERYEHRHEWRTGKGEHAEIDSTVISANGLEYNLWAELRQVMTGTTAINGSGGADGMARNVDQVSRIGLPGQEDTYYETFPLDEGSSELTDSCDYGSGRDTADTIADEEAYTPHIAEGIGHSARNEFLCSREGANDLIADQTAIIHGIGLLPIDIAEMAQERTGLIWSPRSNIALYGDTARVTLYDKLGVRIGMGPDWTRSGSMAMTRELRCAAEFNERYLNGYFTDEQLWLMATRNAAEVMALDDAIGTLDTGLVADIAIFDASERTDHRAIIEAGPEDVALVMRDGEVIYGDAPVVESFDSGCDSLDICGTQKRVCLMRDSGITLSELQSINSDSYPLFFCGEPENEPTCTPMRDAMSPPLPDPMVDGSNRYSGEITAEDRDGDGIPDAEDNCQCTFNPIRPLDDGAQADADGDGVGDECDPCPLDADTTECTMVSLTDRDNDTIPNDEDNCPETPNMDQADGDGDGKGDVCDPCPEEANPGATACSSTIYEVRMGDVALGETVALSGLVVTAIEDNGFYVQQAEGTADYAGRDFSGIFVYTGSAPSGVARGDVLDFSTATVDDFSGFAELSSAAWTVTSSGTMPTPVSIADPGNIATGGSRAEALESVLVEVQDVTVTDANPDAGAGDFGEFAVDGDLRVDDEMYEITPDPGLGDSFVRITGVLAFSFDNHKLRPRDMDDVVAGPPRLLGIEPALTYAREGTGSGPTFPDPLTVVMSRPVESDTTISMMASGAGGLVVADVTVPAGSDTAVVPVEGVTASPTAYTVTASHMGDMVTAEVRVLGATEAPGLADLRPATATVPLDATETFTVELTIPAPPGGTVVDLTVDTGGTVPGTVTVPEDTLTADFDFTAGSSEATATITASLDTDVLTATAEVTAVPGTVVINEVDYDQPSTDTNEFVELYNPGGGDMDLTGLAVVFVNGSSDTEYNRIALSGTLAAGEYLVIATGTVSVPGGVDMITFSAADNNVQNGSPDGIAIFDTASETLVDALSYEGSITAATFDGVAGTFDLVEGTPATAEDNNDSAASLVRLPNGSDTDDADTDWAESATPTPGAENTP